MASLREGGEKSHGRAGWVPPGVDNQEQRFLKAFEEYVGPLFRHASVRLSDRERAIEVVHDTFAKAWGYVQSGHEVESFRPFLYKILGNLVVDEYRRRKEISLDALLAEERRSGGAFPDLATEPFEELIDVLDAERALELTAEIPETYREPLILRFVDGLGPKEIAELIEESENVVSVRIHRGLKMLKEKVAAQGGRSPGPAGKE